MHREVWQKNGAANKDSQCSSIAAGTGVGTYHGNGCGELILDRQRNTVFYTGSELQMEVNADYDAYEPWLAVELNGVQISEGSIK